MWSTSAPQSVFSPVWRSVCVGGSGSRRNPLHLIVSSSVEPSAASGGFCPPVSWPEGSRLLPQVVRSSWTERGTKPQILRPLNQCLFLYKQEAKTWIKNSWSFINWPTPFIFKLSAVFWCLVFLRPACSLCFVNLIIQVVCLQISRRPIGNQELHISNKTTERCQKGREWF